MLEHLVKVWTDMCFAQGLSPAGNVKMYVSHVPD